METKVISKGISNAIKKEKVFIKAVVILFVGELLGYFLSYPIIVATVICLFIVIGTHAFKDISEDVNDEQQ